MRSFISESNENPTRSRVPAASILKTQNHNNTRRRTLLDVYIQT